MSFSFTIKFFNLSPEMNSPSPSSPKLGESSPNSEVAITTRFQKLTEWLKLVSFHSHSSSTENLEAMTHLIQKIPAIPHYPGNGPVIEALIRTHRITMIKTFDASLSEAVDRALAALAENFPDYVSTTTPKQEIRMQLTSPVSFCIAQKRK